MNPRILTLITVLLMLTFCIMPASAASNIVGGVIINDGADSTDKQDVNLTISAGEPISLSKTETTQSDFNSGTLSNTKATSDGNLQLDQLVDGGFESGNFNTWDSSDFQIVTSPKASGNYAAAAQTIPRALVKKFPSVQKNLYVKFKALFNETNQHHYPLVCSTDNSAFYAITAMPDGHFGGATYNYFPIDKTYVANTWYTIECYYFGESSTYKVIIDGVDVTKGGIAAIDWNGNLAKGLYNICCVSTNGDGGSGGMAVDDYYITNNLPPILDDGFESGDFSKWYSVSDTCKIVTDPIKAGYKSAKVEGRMTPNYFEKRQKGYFRQCIRFSSSSSYCAISPGSDGREMYFIAQNGRWSDTYNGYYPVEVPWVPNTWYTVEIYWDVDANNRIKYRMLIDGVEITEAGGRYLRGANGYYKTYITNFVYASCTGIYLDNILILSDFPSISKPTYSFSGTRVSAPIDLLTVNTAVSSNIDWNVTAPAGTSISIDVSLDNGTTWQTATKGAAIPGITVGTNLDGKRLLVRQNFSTTNTEVTPQLQDIIININGVKPKTGIVEMMISNDSTFNGATWESYVTSKNWTLTGEQGTKTVYIKLRDALGESTTYSDNILYKIEATLEKIYDEIKNMSMKLTFRAVGGNSIFEPVLDVFSGNWGDTENKVNDWITATPSSDGFTILTGKLSVPDSDNDGIPDESAIAKKVVVGGKTLLFKVVAPPSLKDIATVVFGN